MSRFASGLPWNPSAWKPMHQHPPHTPPFASTRAAKSGQVSGVSSRVVYSASASTGITVGRVPAARRPELPLTTNDSHE